MVLLSNNKMSNLLNPKAVSFFNKVLVLGSNKNKRNCTFSFNEEGEFSKDYQSYLNSPKFLINRGKSSYVVRKGEVFILGQFQTSYEITYKVMIFDGTKWSLTS